MMKWIVGLLVLVNILFFTVMQWGGALTVDINNPPQQPALNADKIRIASELPASLATPVSMVMATSVPAPAATVAVTSAPAVKQSCMEWGEFSGNDLVRVEKALEAMKLDDRLKQRIVEYSSGYWVYIAPMKTHAQVEKKILQLKDRGVEDYFVVQEPGRWQNAISLGVFKTEEAAKSYLVKLQGQGVKTALVGERSSKLKFTIFNLSRLDGVQSSQVAALRKDFPESELKLVPCN